MKNFINSYQYAIICICLFILGMGLMWGLDHFLLSNNQTYPESSSQWGGYVPMQVYQIYDRDTGVYYAVTEKGGITVMYTMNGEVKLVDQGEGAIQHPNKGVSNVD